MKDKAKEKARRDAARRRDALTGNGMGFFRDKATCEKCGQTFYYKTRRSKCPLCGAELDKALVPVWERMVEELFKGYKSNR